MKKSFMTRALATGLSLAMAFSLSAATNVSVASAAAKPAMKSTTMTVKVGQSKNYQATAATQKAYKITAIKMSAAGKTKATVKINSSKKSIKVTGKAATKGSNVIVTFKNNSTKKLTKVTTKVVVKDETPVDTVAKISDVKQNTFTQFTATMSKALETATASDFTMVRDDDNQVITVKGAELDATDKTKVKLTVYTSLTDAKTYTVTYTAADEAKTQSSAKVTVTDGSVADVAITPVQISANSETTICYQTLDANGVIVSEKKVCDTESKIEVSCNTLLGTLDSNNSKLILYNVGDTATFTVTYHTYKYDATTGAEVDVIKKEFTVTAVKDANVISQYKYTVATETPYDWSKVTPVSTVALGDGDSDGKSALRRAYFQIKNDKGVDVTDSCGYTVESSDNSKVVADGPVKGGVVLSPVSVGSAYLMIKDGDGKVVSTLPITVGEKRKLAVFKLNNNAVSIATDAGVNSVASVYAEVTAKDQYGEDIKVTLNTSKERTNYGKVTLTPQGAVDDQRTIMVSSAAGTNNQTSVFTVTATDKRGNSMSTTLNVTTKAPTGADTYSVVFLEGTKVVSSVDTTVSQAENDNTAGSKAITSNIVVKNNGVVIDKLANLASNVTCSAVKVTRNNDNAVFYDSTSGSSIRTTVSSAAISVDDAYVGTAPSDMMINVVGGTNALATGLTKNLTVGNYTVWYEITVNGKKFNPYATLAVTDKQTAVTASILNTKNGTYNFSQFIMDSTNNAKFYFGDVELTSYRFENVDYTINSNGSNAFVKSVTLSVKAASSNNYFQVTVPVNKTFTCNGKWQVGTKDITVLP